MKKISSIIQQYNQFTKNWTWREPTLIALIIAYLFIVVFSISKSVIYENKLKKQNKENIKQSESIIKEQQKEIEKLKKDVVLHTILADSSIAKANRLSKKQINNEVALSKIDSMVNSLSVDEVNNFWDNRKSK